MAWVQAVTLLAVIQFFVFGGLVGAARARYQVKAPATTGHAMFDRYFRVHMNTQEMLMVFLPALWLAALYWSAQWVALLGVVYLIGRVVYLRAYVANPDSRSLGYALSITPTAILWVAAAVGVVRSLLTVSQ